MKKITCMLLLIQSGFMMAQKETVVTPNGKKIQVNTKVNNGLSDTTNGEIQLGGDLLKPTSLITTSDYTFAIQGLQAGAATDKVLVADANGVLKWIDRTAFTGDNLGNHTATTTLNMSKQAIDNIWTAYFADQVAANANTYGFYKNNGTLGFYNSLKGGNDLIINEATRKTTVNNLAIATSTDGTAPAAGYIATSADASGNIVWKAPAATNAAIRLVSGSATLTVTDNIIIVDASSAVTITIPQADTAAKGKIYTIKRVDNSTADVTIDFGTSKVDNVTDTKILVGNGVSYQIANYSASQWYTISRF
ncbi:hypothetical protein [uncultured Flavobacterium sp.]|uniref:hypothetical protein n=1 Tax=uncultured Flavobacterium sp. TaxID=165435 RepID=UPI0029304718|nr:hypothetical protein [uncultured Flavobacterium sp.]